MWNTILRAGVVLVELLLTVAYVSKVSVVVIFRVIYTHVTRTIIFLLVMTLLYGSNHLPCHMSLNCTCYDRHEHANWTIILSPVVKRPITANQGSTGFFFLKKKVRIYSFWSIQSSGILGKKNTTGLFFYDLICEVKFCTYPGLSQPSFEPGPELNV